MITTIIFSAVIAFLGWTILISARHPEYLILIPFVVMTNFFGFLPYAYLSQEGIFQQADLVFAIVLLIAGTFLFHKRLRVRKTGFYKNYQRLQLAFIVFLFAVFVVSWAQYGDLFGSLKVFKRFIRYYSVIPFSLILMDLQKEKIGSLFNLIEKITILLSFLYVLNFGMNIKIFAVESYKEFSFGGAELYRNFYALPVFSLFTLARILLKRHLTTGSILGVLMILASYVFVYTRSFAGAVILTLGLSLLVWMKIYHRAIQRVFLVGVVAGLFALIISSIFSAQLEFFMYRLRSVPGSSLTEASSLLLRENIIESRIEHVASHNPVTGLGFIANSRYGTQYHSLFVRPGDQSGAIIIGDQSWGNFIGSIGFGGVLLFLSLFFYPILYLKKRHILWNQHPDVYAALIALFDEIFVIAFFSTNLIDNVFLICFLMAAVQYHVNDYINAAGR